MMLDWKTYCLCSLLAFFEDWQENPNKLIKLSIIAFLNVKQVLIEHD